MFETNFIVHLFSLFVFAWGGFKLTELLEERSFLLKLLLKEEGKNLYLIKNPVSYSFFLAKLLKIPCSGGGFRFLSPKKKIKANNLFFFLKSHKILKISHKVCSQSKNNAKMIIEATSSLEDLTKIEDILSRDLLLSVHIKLKKEREGNKSFPLST